MFRGINLKKAGPASPVRIAWIIGENTKAEFKVSASNGLSYFVRLLGLISIILFFSNLLPIPALDGGMILFNTVHMITRKPINPRVFYRYNLFGFFIIVGIIVLAVINDFSFFTSINK